MAKILKLPSKNDKATTADERREFNPENTPWVVLPKWPFNIMYTEPWPDKAFDPDLRFVPVWYESTGNKVYKQWKSMFKLDSNGTQIPVKEKPVSKVWLDQIVANASNLTDLQTVMADQPELIWKFLNSLIQWAQWINQQYQAKYPTYTELSSPLFNNTTIGSTPIAPEQWAWTNLIPSYIPYQFIR